MRVARSTKTSSVFYFSNGAAISLLNSVSDSDILFRTSISYHLKFTLIPRGFELDSGTHSGSKKWIHQPPSSQHHRRPTSYPMVTKPPPQHRRQTQKRLQLACPIRFRSNRSSHRSTKHRHRRNISRIRIPSTTTTRRSRKLPHSRMTFYRMRRQ